MVKMQPQSKILASVIIIIMSDNYQAVQAVPTFINVGHPPFFTSKHNHSPLRDDELH
jgi:hypothetical protein